MRPQPSSKESRYQSGLADSVKYASREELVAAWVNTYGHPPPKGIGTRLLGLAAAYHRQAENEGGLRPDTRKKLLSYATPKSGQIPARSRCAAPGMRLVREWRGEKHIVDILEDGILYRGETFTSLSRVATHITGARWSGPRFFGVGSS
ncbi:MAG: DUF2924 domain-containing protein [Alphaproteobacteria bacterium]